MSSHKSSTYKWLHYSNSFQLKPLELECYHHTYYDLSLKTHNQFDKKIIIIKLQTETNETECFHLMLLNFDSKWFVYKWLLSFHSFFSTITIAITIIYQA